MGNIEDLLTSRIDPEEFFSEAADRVIREFVRRSFKCDVEGSVNAFMTVLGSEFQIPLTKVQLNQGLDYTVWYDGDHEALILDESAEGMDHILDPCIDDRSFYVPLEHRGVHIGTAIFEKEILTEEELACILWCSNLFSGHLYQKIEWTQEMAEVRYRAEHDRLTDCYSRWVFEDDLERAITIAEKTVGEVCLVFLDVDNFKGINTKYSHTHGDFVLQELGKVLEGIPRRQGEKVYRVGGEEFCFILQHNDKDHATQFGERVRAAVKKHDFVNRRLSDDVAQQIYCHDFDSTKVSVSVSVSSSSEAEGRTQGLYQLAVDRLNDAKADGKGFVNAGEMVDPLTKIMRLKGFDKYLADHVRSCNDGNRSSIVNIINPGSMIAVCVYDVMGMKHLEDIPGFDPWNLFAGCVGCIQNELDPIARWGITDRIVGVITQNDYLIGTRTMLERKAATILRMLRDYSEPSDTKTKLPFAGGVVLYSPRFINSDVARSVARNPAVLRYYAEELYEQAKGTKKYLVIKQYEPMPL